MLNGYETSEFEFDGKRRNVYSRGTGPGVLIMSEMPGIHPGVLEFAEIVSAQGFHVALPDLFGEAGRNAWSPSYMAKSISRACINREFRMLAANESSPITVWLRALCRKLHAECGGPGVGAIGMCFTGNFALSLAIESSVLAPVLSQPSLPIPIGAKRQRGLHVAPKDLEVVKRRVHDEGLKVLGLRFTHDAFVPGSRFACLREELGEGFESIEIDSGPGNPHGIPRIAHSVLTQHLVDEEGHPTLAARQRVLEFFGEHLFPF